MNNQENEKIIDEIKKELKQPGLSSHEKNILLRNLHEKISPQPSFFFRINSNYLYSKNIFANFAFGLMIIFISGFGIVKASGDSLPGEIFYKIKIGAEETKSFFVPEEQEIVYYQQRLTKRVDEVKQILIEEGEVSSEQLAVSEDLILKHTKEIKIRIADVDDSSEQVRLSNNVLTSLELYEKISEEVNEPNIIDEVTLNNEDSNKVGDDILNNEDSSKVNNEIIEIVDDLDEYIEEALQDTTGEEIRDIFDSLEINEAQLGDSPEKNNKTISKMIKEEINEDVSDEYNELLDILDGQN
jgi:hypothetical protein